MKSYNGRKGFVFGPELNSQFDIAIFNTKLEWKI